MGRIAYAALSDRGRRYKDNQDRWLADPERGLYLVSDGMAEAVSPQLVVDTLPGLLREALAAEADLSDSAIAQTIRDVLAQVSARVRDASQQRQGMIGATVVLALVRPERALLAHLGDSRIYLFRGGRLEQLTRDHSWIQQMIDEGKLMPDEAFHWGFNGGPSQYAGMSGRAEADVRELPLQAGDQLLLCSDGLTCMLSDAELQALFARRLDPQETCCQLVEAANAAGGKDNITALIVRV
jgi:protein phosphatase